MSKRYDEAKSKFEKLFRNQLSENEARTFLISLYERGEQADEIAAAVEVMQSHSIKLEIPQSLQDQLIDVVGTGGDKSGSFNISSTVAILLASTGSRVAKHGNRSITSRSGSADMLEALGIRLDLDPARQAELLEETGFTFLFAQNHHPAMKHIMPIRKSIPHRTIFNILGPLTNPAGVQKYLMGVFSRDYISPVVEALKLLKTKSAIVVSSRDGMDEISISDVTFASGLKGDRVKSFEIDPQAYGFKLAPQEAILGGEAKENATITRDILENRLKDAKRDIVLLNAAVALTADERARDIQEGIEIAKESLESGQAAQKLAQIIEVSKKL